MGIEPPRGNMFLYSTRSGCGAPCETTSTNWSDNAAARPLVVTDTRRGCALERRRAEGALMVTRLAIFFSAGVIGWAANAPAVSGIAVVHHDGQTFITWTDPTTGTPANYRYDIYRHTSPITNAASLAAATLIQNDVFNNSGQMHGQFPFTQATRQDASKLMPIVQQGSCNNNTTVCGTPLASGSGLAVHTATTAAAAYYAVITTDRTGANTDSPVSPGNNATDSPVSESVASIKPLKYRQF
jgi:hypothetical protein